MGQVDATSGELSLSIFGLLELNCGGICHEQLDLGKPGKSPIWPAFSTPKIAKNVRVQKVRFSPPLNHGLKVQLRGPPTFTCSSNFLKKCRKWIEQTKLDCLVPKVICSRPFSWEFSVGQKIGDVPGNEFLHVHSFRKIHGDVPGNENP